MVDSEVAQPQPATAVAHGEVLAFSRVVRLELAVVESLGHKGADRGVKSVGRLKKEPVGGRHRRLVLDDVIENRSVDSIRMDPMRWLTKLVRIAQQYKVVCGAPDCENVCKRHLPSLVDH